MSFLWDFMRYGFPVVGAVSGAAVAARGSSTQLTRVVLGSSLGWAAGYGAQWAVSKMLDGPAERLPRDVMIPQLTEGVQVPSASEVMENVKNNTFETKTDEETAGSPQSSVSGPSPTPMGTNGPTNLTSFDPNNFGSGGSS